MTLAAILRNKIRTAERGQDGGIVSIPPHERVQSVSRLLEARRIGAVLVLDESGGLLGILSERDVIGAIANYGAAALEMRAWQVMTSPVQVASPEMTVPEAMRMMTERRFRHLPVYDQGNLVGIVSIGDVVKARLGQAELEMDSLKAYVAGGNDIGGRLIPG